MCENPQLGVIFNHPATLRVKYGNKTDGWIPKMQIYTLPYTSVSAVPMCLILRAHVLCWLIFNLFLTYLLIEQDVEENRVILQLSKLGEDLPLFPVWGMLIK